MLWVDSMHQRRRGHRQALLEPRSPRDRNAKLGSQITGKSMEKGRGGLRELCYAWGWTSEGFMQLAGV